MRLKVPKEVIIGVVAVVTIAGLIWGINYLKQNNLFSKKINYFVVYNQVDGLTESSEVFLNGYKVGSVSKISYNYQTEGILVEINLIEEFKMPKYTRAEIVSDGLLGTRAINLDFGYAGGFHEIGDTLLPGVELSIQEKVSQEMLPVKLKAEELMMEMQNVLEIIKYIFNEGTRDNLTRSFESIQMTLANLESSSVSLDTLLERGEGKIQIILDNIASISGNLKNNNEQITNIINNFEQISDSLTKSKIVSTISNAELALSQANVIIEKINRGEGSIGMLVNNDTLYNNLQNASSELNTLIAKVNENPRDFLNLNLFERRSKYQKEVDKLKSKRLKCITNPDKCSESEREKIEQQLNDLEKAYKQATSFNTESIDPDKIVFRVQIKSASKRLASNSSELLGYRNVDEFDMNGLYKYTIGATNDLNKAIKWQNFLRNDFHDAFVIALQGDNQITVSEAKRLLSTQSN